MTPEHFIPVPLDKSYRLMNHGPTVLVSSEINGTPNVMAAAWTCVLDNGQTPKVTVVLDKSTRTREMIEISGFFALQLPTRAMVNQTVGVGTDSAREVPNKLAKHGVKTFVAPGFNLPLVEGCVGWLACRLVPELHNQQIYDLFIGEVVGAWADGRVFSDGRRHSDDAAEELRTIHHVAGGQFFVTGEAVTCE
jgi:flavin reductase (DIM6/NTAB) family NADH-FMN oxidoreductase RutF